MLVAVLVQRGSALGAELGLQRTRLVVDARVDDAGVVAGLVDGDVGLALEHEHARSGLAQQQLARGGEAEDSGPDDDDVPGLHQWIAGSGTPPAPWRKSKSQPSWGLGDVRGEQALVAAGGGELSGHPERTASREFFFRDVEVEAPRRNVERDRVARSAPAPAARRRTTRARRGARRSRRRSRTCARRRSGPCRAPPPGAASSGSGAFPTRAFPGLRGARRCAAPARSRRVTSERGIVDARRHVVVVLEDDGGAGVLQQLGRRRRAA